MPLIQSHRIFQYEWYHLRMDIHGKVVIVTGASMGIGEAAARALAAKGAKVALVARSTQKLEALSKELSDSFMVQADMTIPEDIDRMIKAVNEHYGRIDVLVNNAGQGLYGALADMSPMEYQRIFTLNVMGPLRAMQKVIPIMRAQGGGSIVNISSMVTRLYLPQMSGYSSTKYALNSLSLTARAELAPDNIVVSIMLPGLTDTEFGKNSVKTEGTAMPSRSGMPAADTAEQVAEKIVYTIESGDAEVTVH